MTFVWDWLVYQIPWWVWGGVALAVLAFVHRFLGWNGAIAFAAAIGALTIYRKGQQEGANRTKDKATEDANEAIKKVNAIRDKSNADNSDPDRLHADDGHRRD